MVCLRKDYCKQFQFGPTQVGKIWERKRHDGNKRTQALRVCMAYGCLDGFCLKIAFPTSTRFLESWKLQQVWRYNETNVTAVHCPWLRNSGRKTILASWYINPNDLQRKPDFLLRCTQASNYNYIPRYCELKNMYTYIQMSPINCS